MASSPDSYRTLIADGTATQKIRGSTFLAMAYPAAGEDTARALVADTRRRYHDAHHVCSAWRLGWGEDLRELRHDDGEPPGTAGEPILQAIRGADLTDTAVVVVRTFGGIKLGAGGLARAYGSTAATALAAAPQKTVQQGRHGCLDFNYAQHKTLVHLLAKHGGHIEQEQFTSLVRWRIWLPLSAWEPFIRDAREATAGQVDHLTGNDLA